MLKRVLDIIFSLLAIILLVPIWLIVAIWIKFDSKGPVFHRTERLGRDGIFFVKYKFRTMVPDGEIVLKKLLLDNPLLKEEYENN